MREEGPPRLTRHEPLRVQISGLGGIEVLAGLQDHAHAAIRLSALRVSGALPRDGLLHGREALTHLLLHGRVHAGQIRQRNVEESGAGGVDGEEWHAAPITTSRQTQAGRSFAGSLSEGRPAIDRLIRPLLSCSSMDCERSPGARWSEPDEDARVVG